jgi:hypothetical protein
MNSLVKDMAENEKKTYLDKSTDVIMNMAKSVQILEEFSKVINQSVSKEGYDFSQYQFHPDYQEAKNLWLEYGF